MIAAADNRPPAPATCAKGRLRIEETPYSFSKPPFVHPDIIKDLSTWLSDNGG